MAFVIARKLEMTQRYTGDAAVPVTVLEVLPCTVTQVKTSGRDGYTAVQVATGARRKTTKALLGHAPQGSFRYFREFCVADESQFQVGSVIDASQFAPGDLVQVIGATKGRGFQGVVKRHRFHGQDATHGTKDQVRMPGSISGRGRSRGGGVNRGQRMAGRMGGNRITQRGLRVVAVDPVSHRIEVCGAVPGARGALLEVQSYAGYWSGAQV